MINHRFELNGTFAHGVPVIIDHNSRSNEFRLHNPDIAFITRSGLGRLTNYVQSLQKEIRDLKTKGGESSDSKNTR